MADSPITETEIIEVTKQLLPKKSEDMYHISMSPVKNYIMYIATPLYHIFYKSFYTGQVTSQLIIAKVVAIFKR
jgi:hypothetical protein